MTHGRHWFRNALLALLALALLAGGSLAAGDLFDDDYADCPHRTRMRDGEIADLTVARDAEEADEVNVSWAATDPATWGLGPNAYSTRLVVILDDKDGDSVTKTLSLGTTKVTFDEVAKGKEVTVQMAIVVDTADGDYLISDILEASVNQSLTAPSFSTDFFVNGQHDCYHATNSFGHWVDHPLPGLGAFYYIGYNENFANYLPGTAVYNYRPATPRFRIGLAHGGEDDGARDDVKFDTYLLRLVDEDGDVVPEGDDVPMTMSSYGQEHHAPFRPTPTCPPGLYDRDITLDFNYSSGALLNLRLNNANGRANRAALVARGPVFNVRINEGGTITKPYYQVPSWSALYGSDRVAPRDKIVAHRVESVDGDRVQVSPPDRFRDFPIDILTSDRTYTLEAWAVNEDREVISPRTTLKVHPVTYVHTLVPGSGGHPPGRFQDYLNWVELGFNTIEVPAVQHGTLLITDFTVLK